MMSGFHKKIATWIIVTFIFAACLLACGCDGTGPSGWMQTLPKAKMQPPDAAERREARAAFRQLYEDLFRLASTNGHRSLLAQDMMRRADQLPADPTSRYVLLELAIETADDAGDLKTRAKAAARLSSQFALHRLEHRGDTLQLALQTDDEL